MIPMKKPARVWNQRFTSVEGARKSSIDAHEKRPDIELQDRIHLRKKDKVERHDRHCAGNADACVDPCEQVAAQGQENQGRCPQNRDVVAEHADPHVEAVGNRSVEDSRARQAE